MGRRWSAGDGGNTIVVRPDGQPETTAKDSTMDDELVFTGEDDFRYLAFDCRRPGRTRSC